MLRHVVTIQSSWCTWLARRADQGQTTAEYALVLLGAAAIALLVLAWATDTNKIGKLLNGVLEAVIGKVT